MNILSDIVSGIGDGISDLYNGAKDVVRPAAEDLLTGLTGDKEASKETLDNTSVLDLIKGGKSIYDSFSNRSAEKKNRKAAQADLNKAYEPIKWPGLSDSFKKDPRIIALYGNSGLLDGTFPSLPDAIVPRVPNRTTGSFGSDLLNIGLSGLQTVADTRAKMDADVKRTSLVTPASDATKEAALSTSSDLKLQSVKPLDDSVVTKKYGTQIQKISQEEGIDAGIISRLVALESGGDPTARNPGSSATGLGQLTKAAASDAAKSLGLANYDLTDPETNLRLTARYYKMKLDEFDGNEELAVRAYNQGAGAVRSSLNGGKPLPPENDTYAARVLGRK